mmetsp:Transcript_17709/g.53079  ORF Transcript_17709/g.53079 Transcript_17709/m.53079 type:complete len:493 (+) Transcript_17709:60-1538(+)|eukprot:CAMPEP_0174232178 /NCGR_PEP_ID=MMETSP0417-20130205/2534_1 /TAXON_ID=242541 /ORGANISM="Mayorella sp, Strain BSH-02190019" /LENGTH=492 /DNA_ID=CAMNT_0015310187 /DNA_START=78 /DNA_END=1556 /DNA_ORIENTATION=+
MKYLLALLVLLASLMILVNATATATATTPGSLEELEEVVRQYAQEAAVLKHAGHVVLRATLPTTAALSEYLAAVRSHNNLDDPLLQAELWHAGPSSAARTDLSSSAPSWEADVALSPQALRSFRSLAHALGGSSSLLVPDLQQALVHAHREHLLARFLSSATTTTATATTATTNNSSSFFSSYHTKEEIDQFMAQLAQIYPTLAEVVTLGQSVEGQTIRALRISGGSGPSNSQQKPGMVYNGLVHAREWISGSTVCYIAAQLLEQYGQEASVTRLVDHYEWLLVPVLNPDGYRFTYQQGGNRMWRKNRRQSANGLCVGVDCNRNWDIAWSSGIGTSSQPCSGEYKGTAPFSEPEEHSVAQYIAARGNVLGYIGFHAYGQLIMEPYGYTKQHTANYAAQQQLVQGMQAAIQQVNGVHYTTGPIATTIYPASGDSVDWVYDQGQVPFPLAIELRDLGQYGFLLPPAQILPQGREMFAGVLYMGNFIMNSTLTVL